MDTPTLIVFLLILWLSPIFILTLLNKVNPAFGETANKYAINLVRGVRGCDRKSKLDHFLNVITGIMVMILLLPSALAMKFIVGNIGPEINLMDSCFGTGFNPCGTCPHHPDRNKTETVETEPKPQVIPSRHGGKSFAEKSREWADRKLDKLEKELEDVRK